MRPVSSQNCTGRQSGNALDDYFCCGYKRSLLYEQQSSDSSIKYSPLLEKSQNCSGVESDPSYPSFSGNLGSRSNPKLDSSTLRSRPSGLKSWKLLSLLNPVETKEAGRPRNRGKCKSDHSVELHNREINLAAVSRAVVNAFRILQTEFIEALLGSSSTAGQPMHQLVQKISGLTETVVALTNHRGCCSIVLCVFL